MGSARRKTGSLKCVPCTTLMLNVLHLDTGRELRGGQWQILTLARELRARGYQQVIASPQGSPLQERASLSGFDTLPLPGASAWDARTILLLRRLIRRQTIHIVHAHDGRGQTLAWEASLYRPVKRVASRRVAFSPNRLVHRLKYNFTGHGIIAVSRFVQDLLVNSGVPARKIAVIPDGIELPAVLASSSQKKLLRAQWQFEDQDFVVGHVGAFTKEKGQDVAIEAVRLLNGALPRVAMLFAGDGPARAALERQCAARGARNVSFLGYWEDLYEFFTCLDLFVMPSRSEGLGSSVLLAMAHGLPVVASRTGGLTEIVDQGKTGWLVEPGSPAALARAIAHASSVRERLNVVGQAAREKAREFTSDIMAAKTDEFYHRVLGHG
jgi:glycosyltransferase involved in cell wall biosynthesis